MFVRLAVTALVLSATITAVAPNPASDGDSGEFVVVRFDEPTNTTGWRIADGETAAWLPNRTVSGTVAFSTNGSAARNCISHPVVELRGALSLSNGGEWVTLRANGTTASNVSYPDAPEAERWNGES